MTSFFSFVLWRFLTVVARTVWLCHRVPFSFVSQWWPLFFDCLILIGICSLFFLIFVHRSIPESASLLFSAHFFVRLCQFFRQYSAMITNFVFFVILFLNHIIVCLHFQHTVHVVIVAAAVAIAIAIAVVTPMPPCATSRERIKRIKSAQSRSSVYSRTCRDNFDTNIWIPNALMLALDCLRTKKKKKKWWQNNGVVDDIFGVSLPHIPSLCSLFHLLRRFFVSSATIILVVIVIAMTIIMCHIKLKLNRI